MKLAVSATGPNLEDTLEERFERCPYIVIVDPETMAFDALSNPPDAQARAMGIQVAQRVAEREVTVVLTGRCDPDAVKAFASADIQLITGVAGTVRQAIRQYILGTLIRTSASAGVPACPATVDGTCRG